MHGSRWTQRTLPVKAWTISREINLAGEDSGRRSAAESELWGSCRGNGAEYAGIHWQTAISLPGVHGDETGGDIDKRGAEIGGFQR